MIKKLISIAGLTGSTFSYFFLFRVADTLNEIGSLKISSETKDLNLSDGCYVLDKLEDSRILTCSSSDKLTQPIFYLQETKSDKKFIWKINKVNLISERDRNYFLRFNLSGNQTFNLLVKNPIKYFWINDLDLFKDCTINSFSHHLFCERVNKLNKVFTIISLDKLP